MPIEGIATTEGNAQGEVTQPATTPDAAANNTGANQSGAGTQTAQQTTEAQPPQTEAKFTQADVDRIIANRIKAGVKAELKKLSSDGDGNTVEELQRQLSEEKTRTRGIEAREAVQDFLSDPKQKLNVRPENTRAIVKMVMQDIEFDDKGQPTNIKDAIESAKTLAPALFANTPSNINAGAGRNTAAGPTNMNDVIRQMYAGKNSGN
jgi:ATP-dependent exoDNAse (exonuclease V) beta subunit